ELVELREKYADPRRTEIRIGTDHLDFRPEDLIPDEDVVVTLTHKGYIKRTPLKSFRTQKKGGVGRLGIKLVDEDWPQLVETTRNHDHLLVLTNRGKAYHCRVYELVEGAPASRGRPIRNVLRMGENETVRAVIPFRTWDTSTTLFFVTRKGYVKRTPLSAFVNAGRSGIIALHLEPDDQLVTVFPVEEAQDVILATEQGQGIRFASDEVRVMGRPARGVRGIHVREGDQVVDATPVLEGHDLLVITRFGYGKRTGMDDIRRIHRGGKGVRLHKITAKTGPVVRILPVLPEDEILLITERGISLRMAVARVPHISRATQGVRLMRVKEDDRVVDVARIASNGEEG
ncbi:MAG: DNA gyrase subunit A, partial [Candidatus Hydrothermae bacterium]|nr:DNA gyrase subunit A [Candidatus Hydrothermae bacterium]